MLFAWTATPNYHPCTKDMDVDYHYVLKLVINGTIDVQFVSLVDQVAGNFTKQCNHSKSKFNITKVLAGAYDRIFLCQSMYNQFNQGEICI